MFFLVRRSKNWSRIRKKATKKAKILSHNHKNLTLLGKGGQGHFWDFKICFASTFLLTFTFYRTKLSRSTQKLWCFCWVTYDKIYRNFHTFWKKLIFNLDFGKKNSGVSIFVLKPYFLVYLLLIDFSWNVMRQFS